MAYSYDRRPACDYDRRQKVANADEQLVAFDRLIELTEKKISEIRNEPDHRYLLLRVSSLLKSVFELFLRVGARMLFLEVLRSYEMPPQDRKVIERAAKTFGKTRLVVKPAMALETYEKTIAEYKLFSATAWAVLRRGEKHTDEGSTTTAKVGSFTVINTGGFNEKMMADVAKVVTKAEQLLRKKGLGRVCYGDLHVTNTVHKSTRVLAFYMLNDDSMYIRANLRGKQGPALQSVLHELGHRLQFRFLQSKKRDIHLMYQALGRKHKDARHELLADKSLWPKAGDTFVYKGETFVFDRVDVSSRADLKAVFSLPENPRVQIKMPLESYVLNKHPAKQSPVFVTHYAATDPDENFAEMIAFYCEDLLPDDQVAMLEALL